MISESHDFLFIHRGKTGGNSISEALLPYATDDKLVDPSYQDGVDRFDIRSSKFDTRKHSKLGEYRDALPAELFARLFKFATLRNPFELLVSAYFSPHRVLTQGNDFDRETFRVMIERQQPIRRFICLSDDGPLLADIDYLMRFERLADEFRTVCARIGLPALELNHRNRSSRADYCGYYDSELRALVEERFREDLEFGGYSF